MAGPGDGIAAGAGGHGHLRVSHADREQVIGTLKATLVHGMLAKEEFDLRVSQAFAARTYADLAAITVDLPAGADRGSAARARSGAGRGASSAAGPVIAVATAPYAGVWPFLVLLTARCGWACCRAVNYAGFTAWAKISAAAASAVWVGVGPKG